MAWITTGPTAVGSGWETSGRVPEPAQEMEMAEDLGHNIGYCTGTLLIDEPCPQQLAYQLQVERDEEGQHFALERQVLV